MIILGINVFHADTAACIIVDGKIVAAVEEERFTRIKHFTGFPKNSIDFCLKEASINLEQVDYIAVNYNKYYNFKEKIFFTIKNFLNINSFKKVFNFTKKKSLNKLFKKFFNLDVSSKIKYIPHHFAHIASTYYFNNINDSLGFSYDGSGDFSTTEIYSLKNNIELLEKVNYPNSIGIFYQAFTQFLGFKNYGDEYKVMGLAAYGKPIYKDRMHKLLKTDKSFFELELSYFDHHRRIINYDFESGYPFFEDLYSLKLVSLFGKPRKTNDKIEQIHKDIAASLQNFIEEIVINKINEINKKIKSESLSLSGGCAFNSSLNGKIVSNSNFKNVYISPNPGDAGGAVGAALIVAKENNIKLEYNSNPYLGTYYSNQEVEKKVIDKIKFIKNINFKFYENNNEMSETVAKKISESGIVGWFQDRMEWGPRALGNRSILGDPRSKNIREIINVKIKYREEFRPFAPSVLKEKANQYFNINSESPYMSSVFQIKEGMKDVIPAVTHIDNSARVQTVDKNQNQKFYQLIESFEKITGIPIILNTSLNVGEPICESPENALEIFLKTSMDMLVIQNWVLTKDD